MDKQEFITKAQGRESVDRKLLRNQRIKGVLAVGPNRIFAGEWP